ncbi:hypothetical protein BDF22DRAFT_92451 [Syncephalis plumigaleata]|nr:hypothetical protein BDF22DRAFT_92451 [Syncephalis plumigaleata]
MTAPRRSHAKRRIVFVDPDDPNALFWWPAMVVPESEIDVFRQTMTSDIQEPGPNEHLVCYFEDSSFSVVHERELVAFSPDKSPYTDYLRGPHSNQFKRDRAVQLATLYWETGIVPRSFTWARDTERKVFQGDQIRPVRKETDTRRSSSNNTSKSSSSSAQQHRKAHSISSLSGKNGKLASVSNQQQQQQQQQRTTNNSSSSRTTGGSNIVMSPLSLASSASTSAISNSKMALYGLSEDMEPTSIPLARRHTTTVPMQVSGATNHSTAQSFYNNNNNSNSNSNHYDVIDDEAAQLLAIANHSLSAASASASSMALPSNGATTSGTCTHCQIKAEQRISALLCLGCHDLLGESTRFQPSTRNKKPYSRRRHSTMHPYDRSNENALRLWGSDEQRITIEVLTGLVPMCRRERWRLLQQQQQQQQQQLQQSGGSHNQHQHHHHLNLMR